MPHPIRPLLAATLALLLSALARAADSPHAAPAKPEAAKPGAEEKATGRLALLPPDSVTRHTLTAAGKTLAYAATAGTLTLRDGSGEPTARLYYTAYTLDGAAPGARPVTFFFNGGPGAGSAYLHLGAAGPKALQFP
ncbi:peptidase S10, partial [Stenotrophomonas sp. A3_2]